jgi:cytoskeleton protein RodZ
VFLLMVAVLYHWLRQGEDTLVVAEPAPVVSPLPAEVQALPAPVAGAPLDAQSSAPSAEGAPVADGIPTTVAPPTPRPDAAPGVPAIPQSPSAASPATPSPMTQSPSPQSSVATPPAVPASIPSPGKPAGHVLRFEPAQDAWIQVVDGKGSRFSKLVRAGGAESFSGEPPFRLVVGEAARVRMSYDGHVIDLTPFIGQKVARLTLE